MGDSLNCESSARQRAASKLKSAGQKLKSAGQKVTEATKETVSEFLQSSSLHGLQYIGTRSVKEKICWIAVVIVSMTCCCYQIKEVYQKWRENPIIISYDQKLQSVIDIPFPAVTVCLPLVINGASFDYMDTIQKLNISDESESNQKLVKLFNMVSSTCFLKSNRDFQLRVSIDHYFQKFKNLDIENEKNSTLFKIIESDLDKIALHNCRGIFEFGFPQDCKHEFEKIDTPEGACFSFNLLSRDSLLTNNTVMGFDDRIHEKRKPQNWSLEDGYTEADNVRLHQLLDFFPHKTIKHDRGFEFDLKFEPWDAQFKCFDKPHLYIHHPHDFPWSESNKIDLSDGSKIKISVTPEIFFPDASLRTSSSPEQRQCYFDDEVQLRYFKIYSESNCRLECLSYMTQYFNDCVEFWMPRDKEMRVCDASEANGYLDAHILNDLKNSVEFKDKCLSCLPRCNSITYTNVIADRSKVKNEIMMESRNKLKEKNLPEIRNQRDVNYFDDYDDYITGPKIMFRQNFSNEPQTDDSSLDRREPKTDDSALDRREPYLDEKSLEIVFAKSHVLALKRSPLYQTFDFIASIGGLLGLFIGMSLLSLVEVLYFLTVRLIEKCRRRRPTD